MNEQTLEHRQTALEREIADIRRRLPFAPVLPGTGWPPAPPPGGTTLTQADWDEFNAICRYIRQTGHEPPPGWKPGNPIPEPEGWGENDTEEPRPASEVTPGSGGPT